MLTAVDIPDDLTGNVLEQVATPINIDDAAGIRAAEIRVSYDTTILDLTENDVSAGSVWSGDTTVQVVASVDDAAGMIVISIFGAEALPATGGSLVELNFTVQSGATVDSSAVVDLTQVRLNEGAIPLDTPPQTGLDATDGLITVTENDNPTTDTVTVSGTVYADVNNNNAPDSTEGLPGVTITLINTATNAQLQTTTQSDGRYEFTSVAMGSYRIIELQPAAYLDGGANEISVELVSGQNLTGQDFREIGLRPEFIYNRLFTTLVMPIGSDNWISAITQINTDAENGVVNAQIVAASTSLSQAEGEAPATVDSQIASAPVGTTTVLAAEGEAPIVNIAAEPVIEPIVENGEIITAEGEGSTEFIVSASNFDDSGDLLVPTVRTISDPSLAFNLEASVITVTSAERAEAATTTPAADAVDFVLSEETSPLDSVAIADSTEDEQASELSDDLLATDQVFAVTDSW
jgi:hypothetical protein